MKKPTPPKDEHGNVLMAKKYIQAICEDEGQYTNPSYNTKLYLNSKNFSKIENLDEYVNVEGIWLQSNFIQKIEGLTQLTKLKFLFLQNNSLKKIEGLETLRELVRLDLSNNRICKIEGLENLGKLKDLIIAHNDLYSTESIKGLMAVADTLTFLNLSENQITYDNKLIDLFKALPHLISLEFQGNPATSQIPYYRKKLVGTLTQIGYLDNKSIDYPERRFANAFLKGGVALEQEERKKYEKEIAEKRTQDKDKEKDYYRKVDERMKRTVAKMKAEWREEKLRALQRKEELIKRLENNKGNKDRNQLKLKKITKDIMHLHERFNANFPENCPLSRDSYFVLSPTEYADSILSKEDEIRKQTQSKPKVEPKLPEVVVKPPKKFEWKKSMEEEVKRLLQKHAFDFFRVHEEFVELHPECEYTQKDLQQQWVNVEMQRYRPLPKKVA